jgi:hypothetical protein
MNLSTDRPQNAPDLAGVERLYCEMLGAFPERVPLALRVHEEVDIGDQCPVADLPGQRRRGAHSRLSSASQRFRKAGRRAHVRLHFHEQGHGHTPETRLMAIDFLAEHLCP